MAAQTVRTTPVTTEARWSTIHAKLEAHRQHLLNLGTIVSLRARDRRIWSLRFQIDVDGRRVHKAIYIGTDDQVELLARVRRYLSRLREPQTWQQEIDAFANWALRLKTALQQATEERWRCPELIEAVEQSQTE